jgi:hypothetical protein
VTDTADIRAVRNNNPGNIRIGQPWQGLMPRANMTRDQAAETAFCVFVSSAMGFRALAKVLFTYYPILHGEGKMYCVENIIERWAPPNENNTGAYVAHVAALTGLAPLQPLQPIGSAIQPIAKAISTHEVGSWAFNEADLAQGISLAGL